MMEIIGLVVVSTMGPRIAIAASRRPSEESAFSNSPFNACRGTRITNPVAAVDGHAYAVKLINEVRIKTIAKFAADHKVPPIAVYPLSEFVCRAHFFAYASMVLPEKFPSDVFVASYLRLIVAFHKGVPFSTIRHRGRKSIISWTFVDELAKLVL